MEIWEIYAKLQSEHAEVSDHCGDEALNDRIILKQIADK
jgi:hypothetical protein